jgi:hypothetical protein
MTIAKYAFIIVIIAGIFVWLSNSHALDALLNSKPLSLDLTQYTAGAMAAERTTLPEFNGDGIVFIDMSGGAPGVPYIAYETPKDHTLGIKELIFMRANSQPCQVSAGEYPCAKNIDGSDGTDSDASPVPSGTFVHLVGGVDDQGIVVKSLTGTAVTSTHMVQFTSAFGSTTHLSNGLSVTPTSISTNANCTFGVGCIGNGIPMLQLSLTNGGSTNTINLIPGRLTVYGKSSIILLSATGSGETGTANFLVFSK